MRILNFLFLVFSFSAFCQQSKLNTLEVGHFQEQMHKKAEALETLSGDFTQFKHIAMMQDAPKSRGKMYFKAPNWVKWEYTTPFKYQVLFKSGTLFLNEDGEKSQMRGQANPLFEKLGKLISGCMNGKVLQDNENFEVKFYKQNHLTFAKIKPKDDHLSQIFTEIILKFNSSNIIQSVRLMEDSGDYTQIDFRNLQFNKPLPEKVFQP